MLALLVLVAGALVTGYFLQQQRRLNAEALADGFGAAADFIHINIDHRLRTFEAAMRGVQGFVRSSDRISRADFSNYVAALQVQELLPGVQAVGFVEPLDDTGLAAHLQAQRSEYGEQYVITPPGTRARYAPIIHIEPLDTNLSALGFDVLTNPVALEASELALARNDVAITARLMLVQDAETDDNYSFVMYLPVLRAGAAAESLADREAALLGWVDVPFRMNDLMAGLRGEFNPDIYLEIHDGAPGADSRMYRSSHAWGQQQIDPAGLLLQYRIDIGGRQWTLLMNSTPVFETSLTEGAQLQMLLLLLSGGGVTVALSLIVWLLANARYSAESRFRRLFDNAGDGIVVFDRSYRFVEANPTGLRMLGYNFHELQQLRLSDIVEQEQWPQLAAAVETLGAGDTTRGEWLHRDKSGYVFPAQVSISILDGNTRFGILRDMTQHRKAQERINRLSQFYKALSSTNHAILRRSGAAELFDAVCHIAVEFGGMAMAWVGQLDEETRRIVPVASAGRGLAYLDKLYISADATVPEGRGPTGTALRENRPVCINDYRADPETVPWHAMAKEYGWHSAATFPIQRGGRPFAVLSVYHAHTDAFDSEALALLAEMSEDISFALDNHDREQERERSEQALAESEHKLSTILANIGACIYLKDNEGRYLFVNQQVLESFGLSNDRIIGHTDDDFFDAATAAKIHANDARVLQGGETLEAEEINRVAGSGEVVHYWSVKLPLRRPDGTIYALCGISTDITERKKFEAVQRLNALVFETSQEGVIITDAANDIVSVNRAWSEITGYAPEEALGRNPKILASGHHSRQFYESMWQDINRHGVWQGELVNKRKNGELYPQWLSVKVIRDEGGRIINHIGIISDLSEHKAKEERIEFLRNYDPLTLLPNRALLRDRTERALARARQAGEYLALLFIDLDRFKIVNDSLGPSFGDQLLKEFSMRLRSQIAPEHTLCRQGGDDFILLLPASDAEEAAHVAAAVLKATVQPFLLQEQPLVLTSCIGIAMFPDDGQDFEQLTRSADAALFRAKKSGPGSFQFFTRQMHEHATEVLHLEAELRQAIAQKQLVLHYQPQYDLQSGALIGAEALVRWLHPEHGLVSPARFIPVAEESGLIIEIGTWVLHEAVRQNRSWQIDGFPVVPVAVNLSALQFRQAGFYAQVVRALSESGLPPALLELELTEGIAMENSAYTVDVLARLGQYGISLAIDDFGMGYSSLGYLKSYPIDTLKIDQSFVQGLGRNRDDEGIVAAIISMAHSLGFKTLAEGVETQEQLDHLRQRGCNEGQGFLFSRPLPPGDFVRLLQQQGRQSPQA